MTKRGGLSAGSVLITALLAGCDSSNKIEAPPPPPATVAPPPPEDAFGTNFGEAFRADPNSEPRTPADGDIIPLSFTEDARPVG
jgi:hypothetical protein